MDQKMKTRISRREFLSTSVLSAGTLGLPFSSLAHAELMHKNAASRILHGTAVPEPTKTSVWITSGRERMVAGSGIKWRLTAGEPATEGVRILPNNQFQEILGFGGCFSDAACYQIMQLGPSLREEFLHDLFHPSGLGLGVNRTCIGAADSASQIYSYDEGDPDPELSRFTIDHDPLTYSLYYAG